MTEHKVVLHKFSDIKEVITLKEKILDDTYQLNDFALLFGVVNRNIEKVDTIAMKRLSELVIYLLVNNKLDRLSTDLLAFIDDIFAYKR